MRKSSISEYYDCIIAGAGPAGCSAACYISRLGLTVLLLDKEKFPRNKTCGDGIPPSAMHILDRMGVLEKIEAIKPRKSDYMIVSSPDGTVVKGVPSTKGLRDYGYVIPRMIFDDIIFNHIKVLPGITAVEKFKVTDIIYNGGNACGIKGEFNKKSYSVRGKYIIAADGVNSIIARKLGLLNRTDKHRAFSIRAYFDNVSGLEQAVELHFDEKLTPGYGWIFPVSEKKANVGIMILNDYSPTKDIKKYYDEFIKTNDIARAKLKKAKMIKGTYRGCMLPLGSFPSLRHKNNVMLIGDAGSLIDPVTGEGIFYALASGAFAAEAIKKSMSKSGKSAAEIYQKILDKNFKWKKYIPGYIAQSLLNNKKVFNFIAHWAGKKSKRADFLINLVLHSTTKIG